MSFPNWLRTAGMCLFSRCWREWNATPHVRAASRTTSICAVLIACVLGLRAESESSWQSREGYRFKRLAVTGGQTGFTLLGAEATGLVFTNQLLPEAESANQNLLNGSGVALGDFDNDGKCDIFLCSLNGSSALYRNLGAWQFTNVTRASGLANTNWLVRAAAFADVDGDGHLDLVLTRCGKGTHLFHNRGDGTFEQSAQSELVAETGSTSLALADIDGDGDLDLYVANYGENTIRSGMKIATRNVGGKEQVVGRMRNRLKIIHGQIVEYGEPHVLFRNDGHGRFAKMSWTDGTFRDENGAPLTGPPWDLGLTAVLRDIDQDGAPDLYVCNDFQDPDRLWINNGRGQFQAIRREALRLTSQFSMGVDFGDVNNDGFDDFIVADMLSRSHALRMRQLAAVSPPLEHTLEKAWDRPQTHRNTLFLSRGDGTYAEIANYAGVAASDWSWSINFVDVDLDGWQDVLVATGHFYDTQDLDAGERRKNLSNAQRNDPQRTLSDYPPLRTPNVAFRNRGDLTFEEVGHAWGFEAREVSHSIAMADLDNDGDLDAVVNCVNDQALLYRNNAAAPRLAVRLRGAPPNTQGIGAKIRVIGGAVPCQRQEVICGGRYLGADDTTRTFAAGGLTNDLRIEVTWRNGNRSVVQHAQANCLYEVIEPAGAGLASSAAQAFAQVQPRGAGAPPAGGESELNQPAAPSARLPLFRDLVLPAASTRVEPFDEFARQPLLPARFTQLGPGVAWIDLDNDGNEDLVAGADKGNLLSVWRNDRAGQLTLWTNLLFGPFPDDTAGFTTWPSGAKDNELLVALSSYRSGQSNPVLRLDLKKGPAAAVLPSGMSGSSAGPLAAADVDGDGQLDLFVGGRFIPGRYPEPASSRCFLTRQGKLTLDDQGNRAFANLGLVSGAVFTDLDGDGKPELVLACEWSSLRVFKREAQTWQDVSSAWQLDRSSGLWTSVTAGDFDGDGRMDLVAGNLGLNSSYQQVAPGPWYLYFGDFNGDRQVSMIEAFTDSELKQTVPWRQMAFLEKAMPWLRGKFPSHEAFSHATVDQILSGRPGPPRRWVANELRSMVFLNRGDRFEAKGLPPEAQWAPVFGMAVADFDGDGREDLFLSQNNYAVRPEDVKLDGGRGLILRGDGRGAFVPVSGMESGVLIYAQQRGCAVADLNNDGRPDVAVAEAAGGPVHVLQNLAGLPGLKVRLQGAVGNPDGVGAVLRLKWSDSYGPAREVHGGGGYWSQDSVRTILATPKPATEIEVRWPGGAVTRSPIPAGAKSILVQMSGEVTPGQ